MKCCKIVLEIAGHDHKRPCVTKFILRICSRVSFLRMKPCRSFPAGQWNVFCPVGALRRLFKRENSIKIALSLRVGKKAQGKAASHGVYFAQKAQLCSAAGCFRGRLSRTSMAKMHPKPSASHTVKALPSTAVLKNAAVSGSAKLYRLAFCGPISLTPDI